MSSPAVRPEGFQRVAQFLRAAGHPHEPRWLEASARTAQEAADALGVQLGQIAKSVVFRRKLDDVAVLVVTSGDRRVDERRVAAITGALGRADADFVKARTGFSIGGVSPVAHADGRDADGRQVQPWAPPVILLDRELARFDQVWAAAGHPKGVFPLSVAQLQSLTRAALHDVVQFQADDASQVTP